MKLRSIDNVDVKNKRVVVRVDWNVTLGKALQLVDDTRIVRTLPTIKLLIKNGARQVVILSHLGKAEEKKSIEPVSKYASQLLDEEIRVYKSVSDCKSDIESRVLMLENVRLWEGEDSNDPEFGGQLASLGEIYVNEAFGECHRASASIVGITAHIPSCAGIWLIEEVESVLKVRENPEHPFVVVMGGSKVEDKLPLLKLLAERADTILVGGKLANELQAEDIKLKGKARIILPVEGSDILDIGEETRKIFAGEIKKAKTVVWNGPMGKVEDARYRAGTEAVFEAIVGNKGAYNLVGGGDTLAALGNEEQISEIDHVSTGGGAMLALLEKGVLPGLRVLES
ncbi:MAG: phosphoglycerate kinase [Candidatus Moraniibacteriota bacterium]|nr:MAG: phosphoglycerate kinase [Candidatus Moranbacteria bacterium]